MIFWSVFNFADKTERAGGQAGETQRQRQQRWRSWRETRVGDKAAAAAKFSSIRIPVRTPIADATWGNILFPIEIYVDGGLDIINVF
jgi:hypothetical protein